MEIENETRYISEVGKQDRCDSTVKYTLTIIHLIVIYTWQMGVSRVH